MVSYRRIDNTNSKMVECDGGAAGGAAGGGAVASSGDASGASASAGIEGPATTSGDVLGNCDHSSGEGFFGPGCFHVPSRAKFPLHRWEVANGGSKRKKDKKGRDKKYAYEKGMKVVIDMLESECSESIPKVDKKALRKRLHGIASNIKSEKDIENASSQYEQKKNDVLSKMNDNKFKQTKALIIDFGKFLSDVVHRRWRPSWFTITMVATALIYVISPIDLIPDAIPFIGLVDDALVISWVYMAIKDEFEEWQAHAGK